MSPGVGKDYAVILFASKFLFRIRNFNLFETNEQNRYNNASILRLLLYLFFGFLLYRFKIVIPFS